MRRSKRARERISQRKIKYRVVPHHRKPFANLVNSPRYDEIHDDIVHGRQLKEIAEDAKKRGEFPTQSTASLVAYLSKYRNSLPPIEIVRSHLLDVVRNARKQYGNDVQFDRICEFVSGM